MQVGGNISSASQVPINGVVTRDATSNTANSDAAAQPEAAQQQSGLSEESIVNLLQQDGVVVNFSIDKNSNEFVVKVINPFTNSVIKEIPPQEIPNLASNIQHVAGILVDKQV